MFLLMLSQLLEFVSFCQNTHPQVHCFPGVCLISVTQSIFKKFTFLATLARTSVRISSREWWGWESSIVEQRAWMNQDPVSGFLKLTWSLYDACKKASISVFLSFNLCTLNMRKSWYRGIFCWLESVLSAEILFILLLPRAPGSICFPWHALKINCQFY